MKREITDDEEDEGSEMSMVDVDFDFFDLNPEVDFHALNTLLKQLLGPDAIDFELGALADLILETKVGSTVKVDGEESDPYAVLTIIDIKDEGEQVKKLREYLLSKSKKQEKAYNLCKRIFDAGKTGFLISERLINMPVDIAPPLYRLLEEEMSKSKIEYEYLVLLSKSYTEIASKILDDDRPKKKSKQGKSEIFYFHPEDEFLKKHAIQHVQFNYSHDSSESDSKRAFYDYGIKPAAELMFFTAQGLKEAVAELQVVIT